jgi:hypothetical protein
MGVADFARNVPPADLPLLAVESNRHPAKLHPALKYLFWRRRPRSTAVPTCSIGRHYPHPVRSTSAQQRGTDVLQVGPAIRLPLPALRLAPGRATGDHPPSVARDPPPDREFLPKIYGYVTERRIFSLYRDLRRVEELLEAPGPLRSPDLLVATLDELDHRASHLKVPITYAQRLFIAKSHIALARDHVELRRVAWTVS